MARMGREFSLVLLGSGMLAAGSFLWPAEDLAVQAANAGAQQVAGNAARARGGHMIFLHTFGGGRAGPSVAAGASVSRSGFGGMGRSISAAG